MRLQITAFVRWHSTCSLRRHEPPRGHPRRVRDLRLPRGRVHGRRRVRALPAREGRRLAQARARSGEPRSEDIGGPVRPVARIGTWRWRFGLAQEALPHPARVWRGAGTGSSPHGPPAPRRLPVPRGAPEMWPARFSNAIESRVRGIVAEHLGVGPEELRPDVSLADDLAVDSLDLIDLALALEAEWGVVLRRRALESVRTYGDLLVAVAAARRRAARRARVAPIVARVRIVPARGNGGLERSGELTPYEIEILVADALRAGPGARLEMELSASTDDAGLAATRKRFAWLAGRGGAVSVQRGPRAA